MAEYLVLARKYRSATFEEVVGQEPIATTLVNAIHSGRIAHAFLFTGTRGVGKTTMARILGKALNCLEADAPTASPCNRCDACVGIARGDDMDMIEIDGASNRGIDEIRELRANAIYRPARCRYRIYYIDEVHMLTKEAFNALLKTLEEPPGHVKFIFSTTEPQRLPATIVSRCQRFDFRNIPTRLIAEHLEKVCKSEKVKAETGAIFRVARAAAGSMRDALSLLDQLLAGGDEKVAEDDVVRLLGTPPEERTTAVAAAIAAGDAAAALNALDALLAAGVTLESAMEAVGEMFRHMMLAAACGADSELIELPDSQRQQAAELAGKFTLPALVQAVAICQTTARNLRGLTSGRGLAEAALVRLAAAEKFVDAESLIQRLEGLSGSGAAAARGAPPAGSARPAASAYRSRPGRGEKKKAVEPGPGAPRPSAAQAHRPPPDGWADEPAPGQYEPVQDDAAPPPEQDALEDLRWEPSYVGEHWGGIVAALARKLGPVSGLLRPAKVLAVEGDTLRLGYDQVHEALRTRAERADEQIGSALGDLFGRAVRCEYVPTGQAGAPAERQAVNNALSSAERAEVANDPAVKAVLDFFDGTLNSIVPAAPPAETDQGDQEGQ